MSNINGKLGPLAILGASGHGKVVADCAESCGWDEVVFFDDRWPECCINSHWPVVGDTAALLASAGDYQGVLVAIGDNAARAQKLALLRDAGLPLTTLIHPAATVSEYATIGPGTVVFAGAVVNVDARLGVGCIINTGATVDHDCQLGDAVHISPGAHLAGGVQVGRQAWIGIGASVKQQIVIGAHAMVGAGAAVVDNVAEGALVVGVPAKS
ncbi:MAG: acetyltransferase [Alcanivorax sp.]|nr:acetyltransferase [Alcanivorax sp.]